MSNKKRAIIILAIFLGAIILSALINLCITLVQKSIYPIKYSEEVEKYSTEFNIPGYVIFAVIDADSDFDASNQYDDGSKGLMHITYDVYAKLYSAEHLDDEALFEDLTTPGVSIRYGAYYLRYLFNKYNSWDTAIVAYISGEKIVNDWLLDKEYSKNGTTLNKIPLEESEKYLKKVNKAIDYYKDTYYRNGVFIK